MTCQFLYKKIPLPREVFDIEQMLVLKWMVLLTPPHWHSTILAISKKGRMQAAELEYI